MTMQFIQLVTHINFEENTCWQIPYTLITDFHRNLQWREGKKKYFKIIIIVISLYNTQ